jgi:hypothetical protein
MTQRQPRPLAPPLKESGMAPERTAVITGSASRDAANGVRSPSTTTVGTSPSARLARAEKFLDCNELRCLSKDRPPVRRALYEERSECNDQPQRSGYVEQARIDSGPVTWWVGSRFLLITRRGNEADRPRARPVSAVLSQAAWFRYLYNRALDPGQLHSADHRAVRTLIPRRTSYRGDEFDPARSSLATLTRGRKQ